MKILMVLPTYNEELVIQKNIEIAYAALSELLAAEDWTLLVADNGSTDKTSAQVGEMLSAYPRLGLWTTTQKGRGNALRQVWLASDADVVAYMDADLATDLSEIPKLLVLLVQYDLVVGSRLSAGSSTERSWLREVLSRGYRHLNHLIVPTSVSDLQCGFKAMRREAAQKVLPLTTHDGWFFDTELIALTEAAGFRVAELPIVWKEAPDRRRKSSVKVLATAWDDFVNLWKLRQRISRLKMRSYRST